MSLHVHIDTFSGLAYKIHEGILYLTHTVYKDRDLFHSQPGGKQVHIYKVALLLGGVLSLRS